MTILDIKCVECDTELHIDWNEVEVVDGEMPAPGVPFGVKATCTACAEADA